MWADALPDCPRVAQSRHVHRLDRKEYQSHARTAILSRCRVCTPDSVDDDKKQTIYEFRFRRSEPNSSHTGRPRANPGLAFGRSVHRLGTCRPNPIPRSRTRRNHRSTVFFSTETRPFQQPPSEASRRSRHEKKMVPEQIPPGTASQLASLNLANRAKGDEPRCHSHTSTASPTR